MIPHISPKELANWLAQCPTENGMPVLLDVREPWELQTASVNPSGLELMAIPMHTVPLRVEELNRQRPVACLCHHGARSAQIAYYLVNQGFENVVNILGGIHAWSQELDPTVPQY